MNFCKYCGPFVSEEANLRSHYNCDWHRYNMNRVLENLNSIGQQQYQQLVLEMKQANDKNTPANQTSYCDFCLKSFKSTLSYDNHLKSKKHISLAKMKKNLIYNFNKINIQGINNNTASTINDSQIQQQDTPIENVHNPNTIPTTTATGIDGDRIYPEQFENLDFVQIAQLPFEKIHTSLDMCIFCKTSCPDIFQFVEHLRRQHHFVYPVRLQTDYQKELFIKFIVYWSCYLFSCMFCLKTYAGYRDLKTHMNDSGHCNYTDIYVQTFCEMYNSYATEQFKIAEEEEVIGDNGVRMNDMLQLVTSTGKILNHKKLTSEFKEHNFNITPKLHLGVKQINELKSTFDQVDREQFEHQLLTNNEYKHGNHNLVESYLNSNKFTNLLTTGPLADNVNSPDLLSAKTDQMGMLAGDVINSNEILTDTITTGILTNSMSKDKNTSCATDLVSSGGHTYYDTYDGVKNDSNVKLSQNSSSDMLNGSNINALHQDISMPNDSCLKTIDHSDLQIVSDVAKVIPDRTLDTLILHRLSKNSHQLINQQQDQYTDSQNFIRARNNYNTKVGVNSNKLQKYWRSQIDF